MVNTIVIIVILDQSHYSSLASFAEQIFELNVCRWLIPTYLINHGKANRCFCFNLE